MQIEMSSTLNGPQGEIYVKHNDASIPFLIGSYHSAAIVDKANLFKECNEFLKSEFKPQQHDELANIYNTICEYLGAEGIGSSFFVRAEVEKQVVKLFQIITYESVRKFIDKAGYNIPSDVSEQFREYNDRGRVNYRNQTYIRSDYKDLQAFSLALRFMIPIWGVFIQNVSSEYGNGFKESEAVKMIELAGLDQWPPFIRMMDYVEACVGKDSSALTMTTAFNGLCSEEIPRHLMSMALVRKIAIGTISTKNDSESMARNLFNYVNGTLQRMDSRFQSVTGIVMPKKSRAIDKSDEDNSSVWDDYSQTTDITEGSRQLIEVYSERIQTIVDRSMIPVDIAYVQHCIAFSYRNETRKILPFQKALIFWIIRSISPVARDLLTHRTLLRLTGIAQAILSHCGYHELAVLISAEPHELSDEMGFMPNETRNKITKEQAAILERHYPYYRQETKRQDPSKRSNVAVIAIDQVVAEMSGIAWKANAPKDIVDKVPMLVSSGYMYISGDIKRQLADLIIQINEVIRGKKCN